MRNLMAERDVIKEEMEKQRQKTESDYGGGFEGGLNPMDIQKTLFDMDPSRFRDTMKMLRYDG
jgi:hypothetical protein